MRGKTRTVVGGLVLSLPCVLYGGWLAYRQSAIRDWPAVDAVIVAFDEGIDEQWEGHWYASPDLTFDYAVAGRTYRSSRLNPFPFNYQGKSAFRADTSGWSAGSTITAWYNPDDPGVAYAVNRGVTTAPLVLFGVGMFFVVLMAASLWRDRGRAVVDEST